MVKPCSKLRLYMKIITTYKDNDSINKNEADWFYLVKKSFKEIQKSRTLFSGMEARQWGLECRRFAQRYMEFLHGSTTIH